MKRRQIATEEIMAQVGLLNYRNQYPHQLSGGMKTRVGIARALMASRPLLMDECFANLDEGMGYIMLKSSWKSNTRALMVTVILVSVMEMGLYKLIEISEYAVGKFFPHFTTKAA